MLTISRTFSLRKLATRQAFARKLTHTGYKDRNLAFRRVFA
ncbi:hypothetical protein [Hyphomicrobium sp.]|nr:hypothetical protein [Hyphomicrobium sp.]